MPLSIQDSKVWKHKQDFLRVIIEMERLGVGVDVDLCNSMAEKGEQQMVLIKKALKADPGKPAQLSKLLLDDLGLPVVKHTPAGKPSFDKFAMEEYEEILSQKEDKTAQLILAYRGWQKSVSSNYRAYVNLLSPDGRLRPNYKLHGTKTGRLSCEKPNLQQIPKEGTKPWNGKMKQCFQPMPGYKLVEFDYSQLELRLATAYSKDEQLIEVFAEGRDIFTEMSKELGMSRQDTKTLVYSIQYGAGVRRVSNIFGVSSSEARGIIENFYRTYSGFRTMSNACERLVREKGSLRLLSGRRRHFQYPKDEARKSFNSLIQGGAADLVERAMVRLFRRVSDSSCRMLLQVHDSVIFEIKEDMVQEYGLHILNTLLDHENPDLESVVFSADGHWLGGETIEFN